jgi:DnaK suppressor protein
MTGTGARDHEVAGGIRKNARFYAYHRWKARGIIFALRERAGTLTAQSHMMESINTAMLSDRLQRRRRQIYVTLEHLEKERNDFTESGDAVSSSGETTARLLHRLSSWYLTEASRIDRALDRIGSPDYGLCDKCRRPIENTRLEAFPESERCMPCNDKKGRLQAA